MRFQVKIPKRWCGLSLHAVLEQCHPHSSPDKWQERWKGRQVLVDGQQVDWYQVLKRGQYLEYWVDEYQEPDVPRNWHVLWENESLLVVNKPAGLPVSQTTRHPESHLIGLVQQNGYPDAHLLHRLDQETSGILVLGKDQDVARLWQPKLHELMIHKEYHALVWGKPEWNKRSLECHLTTRDTSPIRCQMHVCKQNESGQYSATHFEVLERYEDVSLIACRLQTGRKHQIRVHLSHLGYPIVGDKIYSFDGYYFLKRLEGGLSENDYQILGSYFHLLHASKVNLMMNEHINEITNNWNMMNRLLKG